MDGMELKELLDTVSEKVRKQTARDIYQLLVDSFLICDFAKNVFKNWLKVQYDINFDD